MDIEIVCELDEGVTVAYYARGHHQPDVFVQEVFLQEKESFSPIDVTYEYWRKVPVPDFGFRILKAEQGSRGAFPVTVVDKRDWDRG